MVALTSAPSELASARSSQAYSPPEPLEDLHVLDLLELTGSQARAARALAMHQSTVCRSVALMQAAFRLQPQPAASVGRYGSNECLRLLRLAYRAHRLMEGQLRVASDPQHQPLLAGMVSVQAVPPKLRGSGEWAALLQQGLIDGAIVPSWCHPRVMAAQRPPSWSELVTVPLGALPLQLVCAATPGGAKPGAGAPGGDALAPRRVLLPRRTVAPLLHQAVARHGFQQEEQPLSCQDIPGWLQRMRDRDLALPLCLELQEPGWLETEGLMLHPEPPPLMEQLWLLLPKAQVSGLPVARHLIRVLRRRLVRAGEVLMGEGELWAQEERG